MLELIQDKTTSEREKKNFYSKSSDYVARDETVASLNKENLVGFFFIYYDMDQNVQNSSVKFDRASVIESEIDNDPSNERLHMNTKQRQTFNAAHAGFFDYHRQMVFRCRRVPKCRENHA